VTDRPTEDLTAQPGQPGQPDEPHESDDAAAARARARRRAEVFGDVLPESTRDDRDQGSTGEKDAGEEWLKRNVPPHHG
jgi:hypothetical protein